MALILLGLVLWTWPHLMKEYTPGLRAGLAEGSAKGLVAVSAFLAVALMVLGYRSAETIFVYAPPAWGQHLNNLLMLFAVALFGGAHSKGHLKHYVRHPMFAGTIVWGVAHLLVRGDAASILLWGGMILWAVAGWIVTNRRHPGYVAPIGGTLKGDVILAVITVVVYVVIVLIHSLVGPNPLPM
ncbi:NnrU family protein [Oceanicola sp. S124]|uniref:NnrU family protein n=1 Tax=Oceanicola sp. S124 TaxID=1042378 RepID=UPI0002559F0A|nr:NnrU family protein [Oceanicola sp. S124]